MCILDHVVHVCPLRLVCRNFCALLHDAYEIKVLIKRVREEWKVQRNCSEPIGFFLCNTFNNAGPSQIQKTYITQLTRSEVETITESEVQTVTG